MTGHVDMEAFQAVGITSEPVVAQVWKLATPLCRGEGMELLHVEFQREHGGRTLRLYLDKPGGITLDDCGNISRQLSDILDVSLETMPPYRLEISSPGAKRPLGKISDFDLFKGCRTKIRTALPINGRKNFTGVLEGVDGQNVQMTIDNKPITIAFTDIVKAHLINNIGENEC